MEFNTNGIYYSENSGLVTNSGLKKVSAERQGIPITRSVQALGLVALAEGKNHVIVPTTELNGLPFVVNTAIRKAKGLLPYIERNKRITGQEFNDVVSDTAWEIDGLTLNKHAGEPDNVAQIMDALEISTGKEITSVAGIVSIGSNGHTEAYYSRLSIGELRDQKLLLDMIKNNPNHAGGLGVIGLLNSNAIINDGYVRFEIIRINPDLLVSDKYGNLADEKKVRPSGFGLKIKVNLDDTTNMKLIEDLALGILPKNLESLIANGIDN